MTKNLSTQLYQTLVQPSTMQALLAGFFRDDRGQALALLQTNGVNMPQNATARQIQLAWLKAIKDSATFRDQAAALLTSYIMSVTGQNGSSNFVGSTNLVRYYNDVTDISSIDPNSFSSSALAGSTDTGSDTTDTTISAPLLSSLAPVGLASTGDQSTGTGGGISSNANAISSTVAPPSSSGSGGSFWSSLGSIFTPKLVQQGISTGLQAYSTNLTASANQTSEKNALALEQMQLAQAQQNAQAAQAGSGQTMLLIVGAGAVVIGLVVVVLLFKGRKK